MRPADTSYDPVIRCTGLGVTYPGGTHALQDFHADVNHGEMIAVVGPSGAGKSTMLRCLNRLIEPTSGVIELVGHDITGSSGRKLRVVRQRCGMIFQQFNLVKRLTVLQNVLAGRLRFNGGLVRGPGSVVRWFPRSEREIALDCLGQVGIEELANKRADQLSGGQQQRVAIARVLAQQPEVILADEPVASLDPQSAGRVLDALEAIRADRSIPVLVNLHQMDLAKRYATRIIGLRAGRTAFDIASGSLTNDEIEDLYNEQETTADTGTGARATASGRDISRLTTSGARTSVIEPAT